MRRRIHPAEADIELLLERMESAANGEFAVISSEGFNDTRLVEKYNQVIKAVLTNNTDLVMALNESMKKIGDSSVVRNMVEKVNEQQAEIDSIKNTGEIISNSAGEIQASSKEMKAKAQEITSNLMDCEKRITGSIDSVGETAGKLDELIDQIQVFKDKAEEISGIAETVKQIAGTSNLLALNASIEAARAGEAGKGFAVVAEEIRSLAVSTTSSANDIGNQIKEIVEEIGDLAKTVEAVSTSIKDGNKDCRNSLASFEDVGNAVAILEEKIDGIADEINLQTLSTVEFAQAVEAMAGNYQDMYDECMNTGSHMYKISRDVDKTRSDFARKNSDISIEQWLTIFEVDHLIFTWRQYNNICGFEKLTIGQVNNPDGCKLGKWIGSRTEPLKSSPELSKVKAAHYALHKYSTEAWEFVQNDNREAAINKFNLAYTEYENLIGALKSLREYVKRNNIK